MLSYICSVLLSAYFVTFVDKAGCQPITWSERAQEQRKQWNIPTDSLDYAVSENYIDSLRQMGGTVYHVSRWFNGATVELTTEQATKVAACRFVRSVEMTRNTASPKASIRRRKAIEAVQDTDYGYTKEQLALYNITPLHRAGFQGNGIVMAICDGGFQNAEKLDCFEAQHRLGVYDFTDDTEDFFGSTGAHGTQCLSVIAGKQEDFYGSAVEADYYLMRSEENETESPKELDNLVVALEKADSLGVNVVSVSLGYSWFDNSDWDLTYSDMDGQKTRGSLAATIAARKGMLVCVAAGNEGAKDWRYITAPADADSILTVGAVNASGTIASFSSRGPSVDGRTKPEVCAVGWGTVLVNPATGSIGSSNGTSFACPLIAGLAASLWSALPEENAMQIRERIIRSANRYGSPDDDYGYGVPDAWAAYTGTTAIENSEQNAVSLKVWRDGQLYMVYNGNAFDIFGRRFPLK